MNVSDSPWISSPALAVTPPTAYPAFALSVTAGPVAVPRGSPNTSLPRGRPARRPPAAGQPAGVEERHRVLPVHVGRRPGHPEQEDAPVGRHEHPDAGRLAGSLDPVLLPLHLLRLDLGLAGHLAIDLGR